MLTGPEVKSVRAGNINLKGSYVSTQGGDAFLKNAHISKYAHDSTKTHDPFRERKLLLNKRELDKIEAKLNTQGVTVVPLAIGLVGRYAKLQIALVRGKKKHDKRETIKGREQKRKLDRLVKNYN
jgi:SsrA-binding protein